MCQVLGYRGEGVRHDACPNGTHNLADGMLFRGGKEGGWVMAVDEPCESWMMDSLHMRGL